HTSRNTRRPSWRNNLSRAFIPLSSARFKKPKLLRILLENWVASLVPSTRHWLLEVALSSSSSTMAVATSPKIKWQSRSSQARWPEQISGFTTTMHFELPERRESTDACKPKVAEEQARFMS